MNDASPEADDGGPSIYAEVSIGPDGVASTKRGETVFSLPKAKIRSIALRHGPQAERPILQPLFGLVLGLIGCYPVLVIASWALHGGTLHGEMVWMLLLIPVGVWLVFEGMRRGYYVSVALATDRFKIPFRGRVEAEPVTRFFRQAAARWGYVASVEL